MSNTSTHLKSFRKLIFNLNKIILQKGFLLSCLLLINFIYSFGQEATVKVNLERTKNSKIKISYIPGSSQENRLEFPIYDPQSYFHFNSRDYIKNIKAYDLEGGELKVHYEDGNYLAEGEVNIWEYELHNSKYPDYYQSALQSSFSKNKHYYLNPSLFTPRISSDGYSLQVKNHLQKGKVLRMNVRKGESYVYGYSRDYDSIEIKNKWHRVYYHGSFLARKGIKNSIPIIVSAFTKTTGKQIPVDYEFHILSQKTNANKALAPSAAFKNGIAISLENSKDLRQTERFIINTMWAIFKTISPNQAKDERLLKLNSSDKHSIHQWYYESLTEYLAIKCLMKNNLITESFFTEIMQEKTVNSINARPYSLIQLGRDMSSQNKGIEVKNNLKVYDIYTNRGVLAAFFMDILLNTESNGQYDLMDKFLNISERHRNLPIRHDTFLNEFSETESMGFKTIIEHYIIGIDELAYKNYYDLIDWQFFRKGEVHKTFIKGGNFTYFPIIEHYVCTNKGKNTVGLEKGDVILSINGNEKLSQIKLDEVIVPNRQFRMESRVKLHVLRNGEEMVLRGKSDYNKKIKHDVIIPNFNPLSQGFKTRQLILQ